MKSRELPITCGEVRPISGAPVAHFQPSLGLSDTLSQAAFTRDAAAISCMRKSKLCVPLVVFAHANGAFGQADLLIQIPGLGRRRGSEKHGHER